MKHTLIVLSLLLLFSLGWSGTALAGGPVYQPCYPCVPPPTYNPPPCQPCQLPEPEIEYPRYQHPHTGYGHYNYRSRDKYHNYVKYQTPGVQQTVY
ncbi:hypothetical protein QUF63_17400 [Anaerolineales bacterium HSG25]|nr:hypothetical protein [Anaerolineales bacterium HSG25]